MSAVTATTTAPTTDNNMQSSLEQETVSRPPTEKAVDVQHPTAASEQNKDGNAMENGGGTEQKLSKSSSSLSGHRSSDYSEDDEGDDSKDDSPKQSIRPSGSKRTLLTHAKDGKMLSEKKLRRLEKNRLSARECRRRKREATENLERQINVLEGENLRLRLQLQIGKEAEDSRLREQDKLTKDIDDLLKSGASEADIYAQLEEFKEKHADYGKSRRSAIEFHLKNIERLLMPTQTTSLVLQAMQGGAAQTGPDTVANVETKVSRGITMESAAGTNKVGVAGTMSQLGSGAAQESGGTSFPLSVSSSSSSSSSTVNPHTPGPISRTASVDSNGSPNPNKMDPKALFQYLVNYLEVTPEQAAALKDSRYVAQELDGCLETALGVLGELRNRLAQTGDDLETEFDNVRSILTPTQAAKFLVWVANNSACMHMLNELWDRVYGNLPSSIQNVESSP